MPALLLLGVFSCQRLGCDQRQEQEQEEAGKDRLEPADAGEVPPVRISKIQGTVEWRTGPDGEWQSGGEGQALPAGANLRTAPGSSFILMFDDGREMLVTGQGQMSLHDEGLEQELAMLVEQGEVELVAKEVQGKRYRLLFVGSGEMLLLREGHASLKLSKEQVRIEMILGSAYIEREGGRTDLEAGQAFVLQIGAAEITDRESLITMLIDKKRRSRIRPPGKSRYLAPARARMEIEPGTALDTGRRGAVALVDDSGARISLGAGTRAVFDGTYRTDKGREGALSLEQGEVQVNLRRGARGGSLQRLVIPQGTVLADARGLGAEVDIASRSNSTRVTVHSGVAEVSVGDSIVTVRQGQSMRVGGQGELSAPERLPLPRIRAREGARTRVFSDRQIGEVGLVWKERGAVILEVARSSSFQEPLLREPVEGGSFIYRNPPPGKIHWRVVSPEGQPGPEGRLELNRDPVASKLAAGKLTNVVPDTGIKTTIYFQGRVPALTFRWDPVANAASYLVRIYHEDNMETTVLEKKVNKARLVLSEGALSEGSYFWYQSAWDNAGTELKTSQMNKLSLAFDNVTPLLRLEKPRPGERPAGGQVEIQGLAQPGSELRVGKESIGVSADGRFRQTLQSVSRGDMLVFRLVKKGLGEVYYVRHLR